MVKENEGRRGHDFLQYSIAVLAGWRYEYHAVPSEGQEERKLTGLEYCLESDEEERGDVILKIAFVKQGGKLIPCGNSDYDKWNKLPEGEIHECEIKKNRNLLHHRKLWAILKTVCSNSDKWQVPDQLLAALKIKLGYYNIVNSFDDSTLMVPGSIRFEVMPQDKFKIFYDAALQLLSKEIGCTVDELERNSQEEL